MISPIVTQLSRFLVGGLFVFSGLIKANDPIGFSIKLDEYFVVFGLDFFKPLALPLSIFFCLLEVSLGLALILGFLPKATSRLLMATIVFFTFLTGWSAVFDVVTDCGCFGDAIPMTPWQSFYKNLVLLAMIGWLWFHHQYLRPLGGQLAPAGIGTSLGTLATLAFSLYAYFMLPPMDFRPYKVGNDIQALSTVPEDAPKDEYETRLVYRNTQTGEVKEFSMQAYTEQNIGKSDKWEWKETKNKLVREGYEPPIHDFSIMDQRGNNLTSAFFSQEGYRMLIVAPRLEPIGAETQKEIQRLADEVLLPLNVRVWALTAATPETREAFRERHQVQYPMFSTDATALKTMIRSNPGLILLKDNTVVAKWSKYDLPDEAEIKRLLSS